MKKGMSQHSSLALPYSELVQEQRSVPPSVEDSLSEISGQQMHVTMVSPEILLIKWNISQPRIGMVASYLPAHQEIYTGVRIYERGSANWNSSNSDGQACHDVILDDRESDHLFFLGLRPGLIYQADFGLFFTDKTNQKNRFCPILRSEPLAIPDDVASAC
ncbi:hypothetical protein [Brevibacillus fulvus]|uniref:DUF4912 domain-containing protein n=1 Tax=Brevibacillus fulvus TaxID=1125967 RepID=A0A938XYQ5_9BACL|nr:hypothetical protein [Brevibacillus fulvus]MBM7589349.1 hypothetical protein [Brevibacillus fulvus]